RYTHYRIKLWVEGAPTDTRSVTYRLHESYGEPLREVSRGPSYDEEITSYGDFTLKALIRQPQDFDVVSVGLLDALRETYGSSPGADIGTVLDVLDKQAGE